MSTQSVRMVVFDLGGVLIRICRSWPEACERAGLAVRAGWDQPGTRASREEVSHAYQVGLLGTEEFCMRIAATAPGLYSPGEVRRVHDAWLIGEYEGVAALIDELHRCGMETGVLSNTNESHWVRLAGAPGRPAEFNAPGKVRHLHASHLLGAAKPGVECFRAFEMRAGLDAGTGRILFFDDVEENIAGAARAGWEGRLIDHRGDTASQMREALRREGIW